jgi:hypothetical protein
MRQSVTPNHWKITTEQRDIKPQCYVSSNNRSEKIESHTITFPCKTTAKIQAECMSSCRRKSRRNNKSNINC